MAEASDRCLKRSHSDLEKQSEGTKKRNDGDDDKNDNDNDGYDDDRRVSFGTVELRLYPIILGDNPFGTWGPPVTLDWDCMGAARTSVENFEQNLRPQHPRHAKAVRRTAKQRYRLLERAGYTSTEIRDAAREAQDIRQLRMEALIESKKKRQQQLQEQNLQQQTSLGWWFQLAEEAKNTLKTVHPDLLLWV